MNKLPTTSGTSFWNDRASGYAADFGGAPIRTFVADEIIAFVELQRPKTLLDLGAGAGVISARIAKRFPGLGITLVDSSKAMLDVAQQRMPAGNGHCFVETSFEDLSLIPSGAMDAVFSSFALHHVPDPQKAEALREIRRVLAPTGRALVVDEIICDAAFEDAAKLFRHMGDLFYPWLSEEELARKFAGFEEYPTNIRSFVAICEAAGFAVTVRSLTGIVAIVLLDPIAHEG